MKTPEFFFTVTCSILCLGLLAIAFFNLSFGVVYDTEHYADTFFILGAAWRAHEGFTPVLDFGHFYGGFLSQTLSWTMALFGDGVSVLYIYALCMSGVLIACAVIVSNHSLSRAGLSAAALLVLALMLTRNPLELNSPIIQVVSAHSFLYNRFAQAAMVVVSLFVALRANARSNEILGGVIAGFLVGAVCLTKSTFVVVLPALFLALLICRRWSAIGGAISGLVAFVLLFDPMLARFFGSLNYALDHVGDENGVVGLIRKTVQIPLHQPIALGLALGALIYLLKVGAHWTAVLAIAGFAGAVTAMTATMGGNGSLGQLALPTLAGVAIGSAEFARRFEARDLHVIQGFAAVLVLGFAIPHVMNAAAAAGEGALRKSELLVDEGPYAHYLSIPGGIRTSEQPTQYEMLADGMQGLRALGEDVSEWGIVANAGISFEHPLRAKPVTGYPLWQRASAPEFSQGRPLSDEVDIILTSKAAGIPDEVLRVRITSDFTLCSSTNLWDIHVHQRLALETC